MLFGQKIKHPQKTLQKSKHKNPSQSLESNQGPVAPQSDALPLDGTGPKRPQT